MVVRAATVVEGHFDSHLKGTETLGSEVVVDIGVTAPYVGI